MTRTRTSLWDIYKEGRSPTRLEDSLPKYMQQLLLLYMVVGTATSITPAPLFLPESHTLDAYYYWVFWTASPARIYASPHPIALFGAAAAAQSRLRSRNAQSTRTFSYYKYQSLAINFYSTRIFHHGGPAV